MRMLFLLLFGLTHAHLIWHGDILYSYAVCGMVVYWLCGWNWKWLIAVGFCIILLGTAVSCLMGLGMSFASEAELAEFQKDWAPNAKKIQEEIAIFRGPYLEHLKLRSFVSLMMQTFVAPFFIFPRAAGLMLIGMGLFKARILSAEQSDRFYLTGMITSFLLGIGLVITSLVFHEQNGWDAVTSMFFYSQWNIVGSVFISFSYVCGIMLLCKYDVLGWLKSSLAAVGQMALTNYLMQSILATLFFYGHGLGMFASMSRLELLAFVFAVWAFQLIVTPIWLKQFRFGPFEWLWRSLSYWKIQPFAHG